MPVNRVVPVVLALALAGCGSIGAIGLSSPFNRSQPEAPEPALPAPTAPVESNNLPPVGGPTADATTPPAETLPNGADAATDTAALGGEPPAATAGAGASAAGGGRGGLTRTDLLGGWTISSGSDNCQLFMTLTSWTGGFRASTRGCSGDLLKSISAWNLDGTQVVLAGANGAPIARLSSSGNSRFAGQTEGGTTPVTFYR
jgi:hypothetical protein